MVYFGTGGTFSVTVVPCDRCGFGRPCPCTRPDLVLVPKELIKDAVRLTHPDRHPAERQEPATKITAALLSHVI